MKKTIKKKQSRSSKKKSSSAGDSGDERRGEDRVNIQPILVEAKPVRGAYYRTLDSEYDFGIIDMSLSGMACERNTGAERGANQQLQLFLGEDLSIPILVRVVWTTEERMGVEFQSLEADAVQMIEDFLEDRWVGQHMLRIEEKYFSENVDFDVWYHGPNNTNLFLWKKPGPTGELLKLILSFSSQSLIYEEGEVHSVGSGVTWKESGLAYTVDSFPRAESDELMVMVDRASPLFQRAMEVLSHIPEPTDDVKMALHLFQED